MLGILSIIIKLILILFLVLLINAFYTYWSIFAVFIVLFLLKQFVLICYKYYILYIYWADNFWINLLKKVNYKYIIKLYKEEKQKGSGYFGHIVGQSDDGNSLHMISFAAPHHNIKNFPKGLLVRNLNAFNSFSNNLHGNNLYKKQKPCKISRQIITKKDYEKSLEIKNAVKFILDGLDFFKFSEKYTNIYDNYDALPGGKFFKIFLK